MGEIERIKDKMTLFKKKYKEFADVMRDQDEDQDMEDA